MIKILERYIAKTIMLATALTALIIAGVVFLITLLNETKNIGEGDYGFSQAIAYVLMRMPGELYQFAPMLILLGSMIGLSSLSTYRELTVMRASGFSIRHIIFSVLSAGFLLTMGMGFIGEWVAPKMSHIAETNKENDKNVGTAMVTAAGVWLHIENNFIHVEHVVGHELLEGVTRYQFDDNHRLKAAYYAKTLTHQEDQWIMSDVVKTTFYKERAKSESFKTSAWDLKFNKNLFDVGLIDPGEMSLPKLAKFARYLEQNGLQASGYQYEFWQRVFQPFASLLMIFLAIPFVLSAFSSTALSFRMMVGMMVGFAFFMSNAFLGQICIVYQVPPILAAFLPLAAFALVGVFLSALLIKR
jgi:lipopolysaccharide export system permease protein